jgi:hypothetical protein
VEDILSESEKSLFWKWYQERRNLTLAAHVGSRAKTNKEFPFDFHKVTRQGDTEVAIFTLLN